MTPHQRLILELLVDRITGFGDGELRSDDPTIDIDHQQIVSFLEENGFDLSPMFREKTPKANLTSRVFNLQLAPIATLAAADTVKLSTPWEGGRVQLIDSPMRSDLAVEVLVDDGRHEEFADQVFFLHIEGQSFPLAIIPGGSPVFCKLHANDLANGISIKIDCVPAEDVTAVHVDILKRSRRNLRDPSGKKRYDELLLLAGNQDA